MKFGNTKPTLHSGSGFIDFRDKKKLFDADGIVCDEGLKVKISGGKLVNPFRGK